MAARSPAMIGEKLPQALTAHHPVIVIVEGGEKSSMWTTSQISNEDLSGALSESLRKTGLFKSVGTSDGAVFRLETRLEDLAQPVQGFTVTVELRVDWRLIRIADNQVLWHDNSLSTYTTPAGEAYRGYIVNLRLATEGAARQNIEQGLTELAAVKF